MKGRLVCRVGAGCVRAELRRGGVVQWAAEAKWDGPEALTEVVAELAGQAELPAMRREVTFELTRDLVQVRRLSDIPPIRRSELAALVALTPHRYFRRNGVALVTDACWVGPRQTRQPVAVGLSSPIAKALVAGAREAGLVVVAIRPEGDPDLAGISLLPSDEEARRESVRLRLTTRLALAAAIAWLGLGIGAGSDLMIRRHRVSTRLEALQGPLASVLAAEAAADSADQMVRRIDREAAQGGDAVATLFRVATVLPDSSFLTQLRVDSAGVGLVAGAARRPSAVLAALEGKAGVADPRFEGRTSRDQVAGRPVERFAIGFGEREAHP